MNTEQSLSNGCSCNSSVTEKTVLVSEKGSTSKGLKDLIKSGFSILLSLLIAFFPKCPVCWGVYMSMFGSLGLAQLPYISWLMPVLVLLFALNLLLLLRKAKKKGYGPFILNLVGAITILIGRTYFLDFPVMVFLGMSLVILGSLWNSFSGIKLRTKLLQVS